MINEPLLAELVDRGDVVFHLAAAVGVKLIVEQPVHTIETNVHGTEVVLRHANKKKKLVLIASTSEVYGKSADVPFREDADLVLGPTLKHRWAYACSKAIDEFLALAYWKEKKLPVVIVRLFNTVGPRQTGQYGMVIPNFVRQALAGQPITVFGDGTQTRSFTYVGDVVGALVALAREPRAVGQVFNIGNGHEISIRDLAERVKAITGSRVRDRDDPLRPGLRGGLRGHAAARAGHRRRSATLIGYEPRVQLDEILARSSTTSRRNSPGRTACAPAWSASPRGVYWPRRREPPMKGLYRLAASAAVVVAFGSPSFAGQVRLEIRNGLVTLDAKDASVREILAEWARVGQDADRQRRAGAGLPVDPPTHRRSREEGAGHRPSRLGWLHRGHAAGGGRGRIAVRPHRRHGDPAPGVRRWRTIA